MKFDDTKEWLETDGLGGFASGTISGIRTRRYHALLLVAKNPPSDRVVLVNGVEAWLEIEQSHVFLSAQRYYPNSMFPGGNLLIESFTRNPWPTWIYRVSRDAQIKVEHFSVQGESGIFLRWTLLGSKSATLKVRPLLSGRDYHSLHLENPSFHFNYTREGDAISWQPYEQQPKIVARSNASYQHTPDWYRNFYYTEEQKRGLDSIEDLGAPGVFSWELGNAPAVLFLGAGDSPNSDQSKGPITDIITQAETAELARRHAFSSDLKRSASQYLVHRGQGKTLIAGYPWFTDWGRDTFIAIRGLCFTTGMIEAAREILVQWAGAVSEGMVPNRFPDAGEQPEYNSVDASLWYVIAVGEFLNAAKFISVQDRAALEGAIEAILRGYSKGTRFGIKLDEDGLLKAGEPGTQLTWMDARVNGKEITPRIGKPVEIQALWLNALSVGARFDPSWLETRQTGLEAFHAKFWNGDGLFDVVDVGHESGHNDATMRPNQIFAVGGLPDQIVTGERAQTLVDAVEALLWTPMGLRTLAPGSPGYSPHYEGGVAQRDAAYHQGSVWPWLAGPFVQAWLRVRGSTPQACKEARDRFVLPLMADFQETGHLPELADADSPFTPRGCPFQAWSLAELIRTNDWVQPSI